MVFKSSQLTLDSFTKKANLEAENVISEKSPTNGWTWVRLGDFVETTSGGTPLRSRKEYFGGNIPWVKSGELEDNWIYGTEETITEEGLRNSNAKIFPKGTLLVAMYGATVGKTAILGVDAATNQAVCAIFPKKDLIDLFFIRYFIIWKRDELIKSSFGGAQPNISQTVIRNLMIPLPFKDGKPDIEEQRRVVARVEEISARIEQAKKLREEALKETEKIMQTTLHRIFSNPEQKGWKPYRIEEIVIELKSGFACSKKYEVPKGIPHLRPNNIGYYGKLDLSKLVHIPENMVDLETYSLKKGDVLFNNTNSKELVGRAALVDENLNCAFSNHITRIKVNTELLNPEWLVAYLNYLWLQGYFLHVCQKWIGQAGINTRMLKSVKIYVPSLEEQKTNIIYLNKIRKIVEDLITHQKKTEKELEALSRAVLKAAFSGKL
jgi:type I restriction enzyme S subunit